MGARGSTASSEAADIVLTTDRVDRLVDVAVILNALRALRVDQAARPAVTPAAEALIHRFADEHHDLQDVLDAVRDAADRLSDSPGPAALTAVEETHRLLVERLSRRIATHLQLARADGGLAPGQLDDPRSCLYGLNTVLRLHFTQEEENYFSLAP